jgi:hypothetical protein
LDRDIGTQDFGTHTATPLNREQLVEKYEAAGAPFGKNPPEEKLVEWGTQQGYSIDAETNQGGVGGDGGDKESARRS